MILHIASKAAWKTAREDGFYRAESLTTEGFIHCSKPDQVIKVANYLFRGQHDLVLLGINERSLSSEVKYENCDGGETLFPHIYGPIEVHAVERTWDFEPGPDGCFTLVPELEA